jgi:GntR family transcriptional regulator
LVSQPAYTRIRSDLLSLIESGRLVPGSLLPSETQLAERYGVTRMTVRHAINGLVRDGFVVRQQGRGTFVLPRRLHDRRLQRLTSFTEDMAAEGCEVVTRVLVQEDIPAPPDIAAQLGLNKGAHVISLARLRLADGGPVALQHSWIPYGLCPSLAREPLLDGSLYKSLDHRYGIVPRRAEQRITAVSATKEQARLLQVPVHAPLLHAERRTYDGSNTAIEYVRSWTHPEYPLSIELER